MLTLPDLLSPIQRQLHDSPDIVTRNTTTSSRRFPYNPDRSISSNNEFYSIPSSMGNAGTSIVPPSNSDVNAKSEFWRLPGAAAVQFRRMKRTSSFLSKEPDETASGPQPKLRKTEEKMLARLRNFHITSEAVDADSNWFFMQRPVEKFDDIEDRMSDDDEGGDATVPNIAANDSFDSEASDDDSPNQQRRRTFAMSDYLKGLLKEDRKRAALMAIGGGCGENEPSLTTPVTNPCTDVMLWKPPSDFISDIISASENVDTTTQFNLSPNLGEVSTVDDDMPDLPIIGSSDVYHDFTQSVPYQRRNARQYSKPIIEALQLNNSRSVEGESLDDDNVIDNSWVMDVDD